MLYEVITTWLKYETGLSGPAVFAAINPIPEPEIYAMMLAGLGVLSFMARRRRKAT